jgi:hypothetical protein
MFDNFYEGIFRLCGSAEEVKNLKKLYVDGKARVNLAEKSSSRDTVASLLKRFFFELQIPAIEFKAFEDCISAFDALQQDGDQVGFIGYW